MLHVLGMRAGPGVDDALIAALDDPELRATAAYLLGREGYRGYPERDRDRDAVRSALRAHLDDRSAFDDPFLGRTLAVQDVVLAAYVRVTGLEAFGIPHTARSEMIGLAVPAFTDEERRALLDAVAAGA